MKFGFWIPTAIVLVPGLSSEILKSSSQAADSELAMWTEDYSISLNPLYRLVEHCKLLIINLFRRLSPTN